MNFTRTIAALAFLLSALSLNAQVQEAGYLATPSATQSILGQSQVAMTNATCNVVTPGSNCTVSGLATSYLAAYVQDYYLTGTLSGAQSLVIPLQPGGYHCVGNSTNQTISVGGVSGTTVSVPAGVTKCVISHDGANYVSASSNPIAGGTYSASVDYVSGSVVNYLGANYLAIAANGPGTTVVAPGTNTSYWRPSLTLGTTATPLYPATTAATNQVTPYQFQTSRNGRVSSSTLPNLMTAMANYNFTTRPPIYIVSFGSSIGVGAELTDPATQSACGHFVAELKIRFPGKGGIPYNFQCVNMSTNGGIANQQQAADVEYRTYAIRGTTINTAGTGYALGDIVWVNQASNAQSGGVIVTGVSGGIPNAVAPWVYPGCPTLADTTTPTSGLYAVGTNIPTVNGPPTVCGVAGQTGTGSGLTVNITAVGYPAPAVVLEQWGMNDSGSALYNSVEPTPVFQGFMGQDIQGCWGPAYCPQYAASDMVVITSHHPSVVWNGPSQWTWVAAVNCVYPDFMTTCNPTGAPSNTSVINATTSQTTGDLANLGTSITVSSRLAVLNDVMRETAAVGVASVIDVEKYWDEAMATETALLGSQLSAEMVYFNQKGPHVNTTGAQASYWPAIDDFVAAIGTQTAQPKSGAAVPLYSPARDMAGNNFLLGLGTSSSTVSFTLPTNSFGLFSVSATNFFVGHFVGTYAFSSCTGQTSGTEFVNIGSDLGTLTDSANPLFTLSVSGGVVTATITAAQTQLFFSLNEVNPMVTQCPNSGSSSIAKRLIKANASGQAVATGLAASTTAAATNSVVSAVANGAASQAQFLAAAGTAGVAYYQLSIGGQHSLFFADYPAGGAIAGAGFLDDGLFNWELAFQQSTGDVCGYVPQGSGITCNNAAYKFSHLGAATFQSGMTAGGTVTSLAIPAPGIPGGTPSTSGGTIAAGTYYAKLVALNWDGTTVAPGTLEATVTTTGSTSSIAWGFSNVTNAHTYQLWVGTTPGGENTYFPTAGFFTQTTTTGTAGTYPTANTTGKLVGGQLVLGGGTAMTDNQGTGPKAQHSTGAVTAGHIATFDATGNTVDGGAPVTLATTPLNWSWSINPTVFATLTLLGPIYYLPNGGTYTGITARLSGAITCVAAPTVAVADMGTSASTVYAGIAGTVDSLATGTADGGFSKTGSVNLVAGHFYGFYLTAGTCATPPQIDVTMNVN